MNIELKNFITSLDEKIKSGKLTKKKYKKQKIKDISIVRSFSIINITEILKEEKKKKRLNRDKSRRIKIYDYRKIRKKRIQ